MSNSNRAVYTVNVNEGYARDLDERKDNEGVNADRDPPKKMIPMGGTTTNDSGMKRPIWKRWTFWTNSILLIIILLYIILHEFNFLPQYRSGFYCDDPKISFSFTGDTISISCLLIVCTFVPLITLTVVELIRCRADSYSSHRIKRGFKNAYIWYGEYILSIIFIMFFMEVIKGIIGEPRPHFLETCKPDKAVNCTKGTYIDTYTCTNTKYSDWFVSDTIKSFPSGHTALSILMSIFLFCYFQKRVCDLQPKLLGPVLQMLAASWACICSCSRVIDHRHHWWDVLGGAIIGLIISYYSVAILCLNFACSNSQMPRTVAANGENGLNADNHSTIKRTSYNTPSGRQDDGLRQIT